MSIADWIAKIALGDNAQKETESTLKPIDSKLRDGLRMYIDSNFNTPYITHEEKDRAAEAARRYYEEKLNREVEQKRKEEAEQSKSENTKKADNRPADGDPGVRYSLTSDDDMLGLSRHADAFVTNKNRYLESMSFTECLRVHIIRSGMENSEIYRKANLSKSVFSSILSKGHIPKKGTIVALSIALKLDLRETERLLMKAGYTFSNSIKGDLIAVYFINHRIYDIDLLNRALYENGEPILGSKSY